MLVQKRKTWFLLLALCSVVVYGSILGIFTVLAQDAPAFSTEVDALENGTIPPSRPITKKVTTNNGTQPVAYAGEQVTYSIVVGEVISPGYRGLVGVTDTLPAHLFVDPGSIAKSTGDAAISGTTITWTLVVSYGSAPYTLTYRALAVLTSTSELTISNVATLWEKENLGDPGRPPTNQTLSTTAELRIRPQNQYLPMIAVMPTSTPTPTATPTPTPTAAPTPGPLPTLANHNFEEGRTGWTESVRNISGTPVSGKLIYSQSERPVIGAQGSWYAWLGGAANQINELSQSVDIPSGYSDVRVRFLFSIRSQETTNCENDLVQVRVNATPVPVTPEPGSKHELCVNMPTYFRRAVTQNLSDFAGQRVTLSFWTRLNGTLNSNYFLDVVELCSDQLNVNVRRCDFSQ